MMASLAVLLLASISANTAAKVRLGDLAPSHTDPLSRYQNSHRLTVLGNAFTFLKLDSAALIFPGQRIFFDRLYRRMEEVIFTRSENINIVHLGGSHVQAGMIGHRMRENFNDLSPGLITDRGLLVPFKVGKTNSAVFTSSEATGQWEACRCVSRKDQCSWGMSGFSLTTPTPNASLKLWALRQDSSYYSGKLVRLYHTIESNQLMPVWNGSQLIIRSSVDTVSKCTTWELDEPTHTLSFRFVGDSARKKPVTVHGAWLGGASSGITYHEIGVNGASTRSYLRCQDFNEQLATLHPDLVIFGIGVNDAHVPSRDFKPSQFIARYDSLIQQMRVHHPEVAILFITNSDNYYKGRPNTNGSKVRDAMLKLAARHNAAVWDLHSTMGGTGAISEWVSAGLAQSDRIHFTRKGYYLIADLLYGALIDDFTRSMSQLSEHNLNQHPPQINE